MTRDHPSGKNRRARWGQYFTRVHVPIVLAIVCLGPSAPAHGSTHATAPRAYDLGRSFDGLRLVHHEARLQAKRGIIADAIYCARSTCRVGDAEIQTWNACSRNPAMYKSGEAPPFRQRTIRGVPALEFSDEPRIELSTGDVTVVVFTLRRSLLNRATQRLQSWPATRQQVKPRRSLPKPVAGAINGTLQCG